MRSFGPPSFTITVWNTNPFSLRKSIIYIIFTWLCQSCIESINMCLTHSHTHTHVRTHTRAPPPPPSKKRTTKTWKTQTRPQTHVHRHPQRAKHRPPPPPRPTQYTQRDKRKDIILTDCSHSGHSTPLAVISNWRQLKSTIVMSERCMSSNSSSSSATFVFGFLLGPGSLSSSLDSSTVSFALKNLIFLAEATGIGSTADDVEGRGSGESLFRYWLVLLWSSFFFPTLPALAEFVDCSKLCPCLFLAFSTTKSSLNLWNTTISCKTSKRRVKSKWPAQQASANHNVRFRHVTRFSQSLYKGLNSATSVWGCFRQLNLGSCYWNWATVIVRFFLSKMSGGLPGFVEYN